MISRTALWPAALAGLLAVAALVELVMPPDAAPALPPPRLTAAAAPEADGGLATAWSGTILARPIFRQDRRPVSAAPAAPAEMPKLSAIVITGAGAAAIFVDSSGAVTAVRPGGLVDGQVVKSITAGAVTLTSPTGTTTLRPQFGTDQSAPQTAPQANAPSFVSGSDAPPPGMPVIPPPSPLNAGVSRDVPLAGIPNNVDRP